MAAGVGHVLGKSYDRSHEIAATNGGPSVALGVAYRSQYLFVPWVEAGWAELQTSRERPKATPFSAETASDSRLSTSYLLLGPSVEYNRLRWRAGVGMYRTQVWSRFAGRTIEPSSWDMGYSLAYGVRVHDERLCGWGLEAFGLLMSESQLAYVGLALRVWGNAWTSGRR
ncbi:MAG: hypothetical protein JW940_23540 [Polyangiaceae bacterium]|nr:hypothetical protein [Polyangiaceae bacterium]